VFVCLFTYIERRRGCQRYYLCTDFTDGNTLRRKDIQVKRPDIRLKCNLDVTVDAQVN